MIAIECNTWRTLIDSTSIKTSRPYINHWRGYLENYDVFVDFDSEFQRLELNFCSFDVSLRPRYVQQQYVPT